MTPCGPIHGLPLAWGNEVKNAMTVESDISRAVYEGNGATTVFPFAFKVWEVSQLSVTLSAPDGTESVASGWTAELTDSGGSVCYRHNGSPLPEGWRIVILRNMPFVQDVDLLSGTRFDPAVIETALDQATAERQQLRERLLRSIALPSASDLTPEEYGQELLSARDDAALSAAAAAASAQEAKNHAAQTAEIKAAALRELREEGDAQATRLDNLAAGHVLTFEREIERAHEEADRAETAADRAEEAADRGEETAAKQILMATAEAERACACADMAQAARDEADRLRHQAANAATEATEQADRAETAATDAELAAKKSQAAACLNSRGKIAIVQDAAMLPDVPDGFYVVDAALVVPALCAQPLTSVASLNVIPETDCFFVVGGEMRCDEEQPNPDPGPEQPEEPDTPEVPDGGDYLICGRRRRRV